MMPTDRTPINMPDCGNDTLGTTTNVNDMANALVQRVQELRSESNAGPIAEGVYIHDNLMLAAQDAALKLQGNYQGPPLPASDIALAFGYRAEEMDVVYLEWVYGTPAAPADVSSLITEVAWKDEPTRMNLRDPKWNEIGTGVYGSCYGIGCVILLSYRVAAPGPNPDLSSNKDRPK